MGTRRLLVRIATQYDGQGTKQATNEVKDLGNAIKNNLGSIAAGAAAAAGAAIVKFANDSVKAFQGFDKGMREVFTLLPGLSEEAMGAVSEQAIQAAKDMGKLPEEVVPALYQALSAGVPPDTVFDFIEAANQTSLAGVIDLESAVVALSQVTNAYGSDVITAGQASDLLFTAVKGGITTMDQLSSSLSNVTPISAALGVEFGNITAALATVTSQGTTTATATTSLRQLLVELSKDGTKVANTFERLSGQSFKSFIADGGNLQQALQILEQGAADAGIGVNDLFGSVEAGTVALQLTGSATEKFTQELLNAEEAAGATAAAADTMTDSLQHLEDRANATSEAMKIQAGQAISPLKREWFELKLAVSDYFAEDLKLRNQILSSSDALEAYGYSGVSLQKALGALGEGTTFWRDSLVDADTMARRTTISVGLLDRGFQGSADSLGNAVRRIEDANNASNDYSNTLAELNQLAAEQAVSQQEPNRAATDYAMSLDELRQMGAAAAQVQREELAVSQEAAAEAARLAAERTAELARESGTLFTTLSAAEGPIGVYYQSLEDIANGAGDLTLNQDSLNNAMITAASNAGASASQLALLKVATGELSAEQAEAVIKQVALEQTLQRLGEMYADGSLSMGDYITAARQAVIDVNNMTVEFDTQTGSVNTDNEAIGTLIGTMGQIPSEIRTHISVTSDPLPNMPGGSTGPGVGNETPQARAVGGPVTAGQPYLVGEQGPEMFYPGISGSIAPNNALGGASLNAPINVYVANGNVDDVAAGVERGVLGAARAMGMRM